MNLTMALTSEHIADLRFPSISVARNGRSFVYVGGREGSRQLYLRSLEKPEATPIPGTEEADGPFISWDGTQVAFFADGKVKIIAASGALP